ncbi:MAG: glycosyl hydrolase family 28-related protein [Acidobacteriota bacterium]
MMVSWYWAIVGLWMILVFGSELPNASRSALWGQEGELWTPYDRLPDFSFAGYHRGNDSLPDVPVKANVRDFGAVGDGESDDSQAFLDAIASVSNGAVLIPAGRYRLTRVLKLSKSHVVLRGESRQSTTLSFQKPLSEIVGPAPALFGPEGHWSWAGGLIWCGPGGDQGKKLADIVKPARRGDRELTLSSVVGITVGTVIRVVQQESDGSLGRHLHAEREEAGECLVKQAGGRLVDFASGVAAVSGNTLRLERPLRADVRLKWRPAVFSHKPILQEVGVEHLTIEFPGPSYEGHIFREAGYNAIYLDGVSHSWVRNVTIIDADSGILTVPSVEPFTIGRFCTLEGIRLVTRHRNKPLNGHHGIALESPQDYLVTDFELETQFVHDLTVDSLANGNVFSKGRGQNLNFDHHRGLPFENLFTEIEAGLGTRLWENGGAPCAGPYSGARETLWNIRAATPQHYPDYPQLNIVGMTAWNSVREQMLWIESIAPDQLVPQNLYVAQRSHRLSRAGSTAGDQSSRGEAQHPSREKR